MSMMLVRRTHKRRKALTVRRWKNKAGDNLTLSQRPSGEWEMQWESADGEEYKCAIGPTPKAAMAELKSIDVEDASK